MFSIRRFNPGIIFLLTAANLAFSRPVVQNAGSINPETYNQPPVIKSRLIEINSASLVVEFEFPRPVWSGGTDSIPAVTGCEYIFQEGYPRLPNSLHVIQAPPGDFTYKVIDYESTLFNTGHIPAFTAEKSLGELSEKTSVYKRNAFYPSNPLEIGRIGNYHGRELIRIAISPIRYNPLLEKVEIYSKIRIRIDFKNVEGVPGRRLSNSAQNVLNALLHEFPQTSIYPSTPPNQPSFPDNLSDPAGIKIAVSSEGLYRVTYQALVDSGINPADLGDPRNFSMTNRGNVVPIYVYGEADGVFNSADYIDFWGEPNWKTQLHLSPDMYKDPWTDENIYWLSWGNSPGAHLAEESGEIIELNHLNYYRPYNFRSVIHIEEDNNFDRLSQVPRDTLRDHWYFDTGVDANETKLYNFFLPDPDNTVATGPAQVKAPLMGYTYPVPNGNPGKHYAIFSVNNYSSPAMEAGAPVGGEWPWEGQELWMIDTQGDEGFPNNYLHHGINNVRVYCSGNTPSGNNNTIMLNWFEISYTRKYLASLGYLKFTAPENSPVDTLYNFVIDNFPSANLLLYKIGASRMTNFEVTENPLTGDFKLRFQDRLYGGEQFVALVQDSVMMPDWIALDNPSDLKNPLNQAEYLVITHPDFLENEMLLEHLDRRSQYGSMLIDVHDIYDEFNYGIKSPEAIRDFLSYAYNYWADPKPFNVLLAGDGSWDQKNIRGEGGNLIPSYYLQTASYGWSSADYWYVLLDGYDYIPEMTIGRIPARENEELDLYLDKIIQTEDNPIPGYWHNRYLFITGKKKPNEQSFILLAQEAIDLLPHWQIVERLETESSTSPYFGGNAELSEFFDTGVSIVSYNGHGGGSIWDDNNIMDVPRVASLNNEGRYPFIANFTCYICQFDAYEARTTLGEEFIFSENKGALGVYGSTALGWFGGGSTLQKAMSTALAAGEKLTMGELVTFSKINFLGMQLGTVTPANIGSEAFATLMNMTFLGDPAAPVNTPEFFSEIILEPMISGSDPLELAIDVPVPAGEAVIRLYDVSSYPAFSGGVIWQSPEYSFADNHLSLTVDPAQITFPESGSFRISYYSDDNQGDGGVFADFMNSDSLMGTEFDSMATIPAPFFDDDSLRFRTKIYDPNGIAWAKMVYALRENVQPSVIFFQDTLDLYPVDEYQIDWITDPIAPPADSAYLILRLTAFCEDVNGDSAFSGYVESVILDHQPDLWLNSGSIFLAGEKNLKIAAHIQNFSNSPVDSALVHFYARPEGGTEQFVGAGWAHDISLYDSALVEVTPNPPLLDGNYTIRVIADPFFYFEDQDTTTNYAQTEFVIDRFNTDPASGTNTGGINTDFHFDDLTFGISPAAVADSTLLFVELLDTCTISQGNLDFYDDMPCAYFRFSTQPEQLLIPDGFKLNWQFPLNDSISIEGIAVHHRELTGTAWSKLNTTVVSDTGEFVILETVAGSLGLFGLLINSDTQPPAIEITVDGQTFTDGGYVPARPRINAIFSDVGGVDQNSLWVMIDDDTLETEFISPPVNSENYNTVSISFEESLTTGTHTIKLGGQDLSGNPAENTFAVQVSGGFAFRFIGNYPNPFKDETYFAYSLTDQPDGDIVLKIYTVSGRLIKTLRQPAKINYDEILWNGRDESGKFLANGVYFCKVKVHKGSKKIEKVLKIAKVR